MAIFDLRSDTVTRPTEEMRKAMYLAEVGDDVYEEDFTVKKLEITASEITGKEAALFVPSGTMANQIAMMCFLEKGMEAIVEANSHIFFYENAAVSLLTGSQLRTLKAKKGILTPEILQNSLRPLNDIHQPLTKLICIENTHNRAGGICYSLEQMKAVFDFSHQNSLPLYMDSARLFNAATFLNVDVKEICQYTDALMFCLSKGLCAPVGSLLLGTTSFIEKAKRYRKLLGGGMRQAGILAAAGIVALKIMSERLIEDHAAAQKIAKTLLECNFKLHLKDVQTNIIIFDVQDKGYLAIQFVEKLKTLGILATSFGKTQVRLVTHYDLKIQDIESVCSIIQKNFR